MTVRSTLCRGLTGARRARADRPVLCSAGGGGGRPGPPLPDPAADAHARAISVLQGARALDWRALAARMGGTAVVSDEEHRGEVQAAARDGRLSFGFSAGGLLFPFYVGVSAALQDAGLLTEDTKLGGASAGSLIAACVKAGMSADEITEHCLRLMADCRAHGTRGRLGPVLNEFLESHMPEDAHERCRDRAYVAVTRALPYLRPQLVTDFSSRDDLIRALMTSCHIPWYLDRQALTEFRGEPHFDGGLTNFIPVVPGTVGVRVCCFPSRQLSPMYRIGISPDSYDEDWPYSLRQMVGWAFEPADDKFVQYFIEKGRSDATAWMEHMGLGSVAAEGQGQVAAAKEAAAGSASGEAQARQEEEGARELARRAAEQVAAGKA